jgi:hypothetical protein
MLWTINSITRLIRSLHNPKLLRNVKDRTPDEALMWGGNPTYGRISDFSC